MKRCIVCGNIGNDDSAICNVCGNPYIDLDDTSDDDTTSSEIIEKMEAQLRQVWTKVKSDGPVVGQTSSTEASDMTGQAESEADLTSSMAHVASNGKEPGATFFLDEDTFSSLGTLPGESSQAQKSETPLKKQVKTNATERSADNEFGEDWFESVALDDEQRRVEEMIQKSTPADEGEWKKAVDGLNAAAEAETARRTETERQAAEAARQEKAIRLAEEKMRQAQEEEAARKEETDRQAEAAWRAEVEHQEEEARQTEAVQQEEIACQTKEMTRATGQGVSASDGNGQWQAQSEAEAQNINAGSEAGRQKRVRRSRGGAQIYGQAGTEVYSGAQGVIRRDVHDGHVEETIPGNNGYTNETVSRQSASPQRAANASAGGTAQQGMTGNAQSGRSMDAPRGGANGARGNAPQAAAPNPQQRVDRNGQPVGNQTAPAGGRNAAGNRAAAYGAPRENRPPQGNRPPMPQGNQPSELNRRVVEAARDALGSPLLIVIAFFQTLYFASSVEAIFMRQLNYEQIAKLLNLLNLPSQVSGYVSMFQSAMAQLDSGALALNLLIRVPDLLFCLGLWLLCITVHTTKERMSGAGFLFMQIVVVLRMIVACVILLVVLVLSVTLVIASWSAGTQNLITIAVVTLVAAIIVTMMVIMYYFCYLSTIRVIKNNARDGVLCGKVSGYVAVITMIVSLTGIISLLSGIVNLEVTGITSGVGRIAWMILFGVWIQKYKSTLKEYNENR